MPFRIFLRAARVTLGQKFFIAFLDELGNFKHFETYFFLAIFGPKNRQFGDLAPQVAKLAIFQHSSEGENVWHQKQSHSSSKIHMGDPVVWLQFYL